MPALKPAGAKPLPEPITIKANVDSTVGLVTLNIYDGTRRLMKEGTRILLTVHDGAQNQLFRDYVPGPTIPLKLPVHNNFADDYSIVAYANGYEQAGFQPVIVNPHTPQTLDLMLLAKKGAYHFAHAQWADIQAQRPHLAQIFSAGVDGGDPSNTWSSFIEDKPAILACLLNITTAMQQIMLPVGTALDYFQQLNLEALAPDRIFGFADAQLLDQVRLAAQHGEFATEPAIDLSLHGDATASYKQIQFGEANVQLTFHGKETKVIDGVDCVYLEPDIDYYKDPLNHLILEVIPNGLTGGVTNPRVVYVLRWIAGRHAGVPEFDPLYTIE